MTQEDYIARCAALGIPSLALREMPSQTPWSPAATNEPDLLHNKPLSEAPRPEPPPMPDLSHLCNKKTRNVSREYWGRMTPEQRAVEAAKRRENGKAQKKP